MTRAERRQWLRSAFGYACGYCGVTEVESGSELDEDHYQPPGKGGTDALDNLVYSCPSCNRLKGSYWSPDPASPRRILHPKRDPIASHVVEMRDGRLMSLTETGAFHIRRLRLNRPQLVALRVRRREDAELRLEYSRLFAAFKDLADDQARIMELARRALAGDDDARRHLREALHRMGP